MSEIYIRRLRAVQWEFYSAREAIGYVRRNWQKQNIYAEMPRLKPSHFDAAGGHVEATYFIRLYAEFEGILKDHLATNHPVLAVPDKPKVDWLISRAARAEGITIDSSLRRRMDNARDYRNSIAHRTRAAVPAIALVDALSTLNRFLAKPPDPLT